MRPSKTLVLDFDGVLHSYRSGWRGATSIPDPPVPGAIEFLHAAVKRFHVAILSSRARDPGGIDAMRRWLVKHGVADEIVAKIRFVKTKIPAHVYLDDRAWRFDGVFPSLDAIEAFEPWHRRDAAKDPREGA